MYIQVIRLYYTYFSLLSDFFLGFLIKYTLDFLMPGYLYWCFQKLIYLRERQKEIFHHRFTPQMPITTEAGSGQKPGDRNTVRVSHTGGRVPNT